MRGARVRGGACEARRGGRALIPCGAGRVRAACAIGHRHGSGFEMAKKKCAHHGIVAPSLTRHAGLFSTAGVRRDGATARPRHRSAENDVGDDGDGGHDSCAAIARRSDDDGTREQSAPPFFSSTACRRLRQPAHLRKIAARMWWMCVMRASIDRVAATRRLRPSSSRTAGRSGLREQTLAKSNWGSLLLVGGGGQQHGPPSLPAPSAVVKGVKGRTPHCYQSDFIQKKLFFHSKREFFWGGSRMTPEPPPSLNTLNRLRLTEPDVRVDTVGNVRTPLPVRSNRPIKKRGEMDRWEEESVQTTHKEKR